jgi:prolyl-tRNA synthetase
MKDAYSFHDSLESLDQGYQKMYQAYRRIFSRCGLPYVVVEAESGPIGGDASHEFMVQTDAGEDLLVHCGSCGYAANTERAEPAPLPQDQAEMQPLTEVHTPGQRTIDEVTAFLNTKPEQMIKTLVYVQTPDRRSAKSPEEAAPAPVVVLVRGDHEVNENKLGRAAGVGLELADEATILELTGAEVGFAGPHALDKSGMPYRLIVDQAVAVMRNAATGACRTDYHVTGVNPGRDFPLAGESVIVGDVRSVAREDHCVKCGGSMTFRKCIEVGHVFKLGTKYSDALQATYLNRNGQAKPFIMGCYGIGLNRIMAAAIESGHDQAGIIWPMSIAPFEVLIVALDPRNEEVMTTAAKLHDDLIAAGIEALLDDRDERAGFKFKDADLIGIPLRITVGRKSLTAGVVELKQRAEEDLEKLAPDQAAKRAAEIVSSALAQLA